MNGGIQVILYAGEQRVRPVPTAVSEAFEDIEVIQSSETRSGFQISLRVDRDGFVGARDYRQIASPALRPSNRMSIMVVLGARCQVLMDGIITRIDLDPDSGRMTVTGEDLGLLMDREEKVRPHYGSTYAIVANILASYAGYGIVPHVTRPELDDPPDANERVAVQRATDLAYLELLARRHGYIFHIDPGPAPGTSKAYWGPPPRMALPQPALTVALGGARNVESIRFHSDALAPTLVKGLIRDRISNKTQTVQSVASTRPRLSKYPFAVNARIVALPDSEGASTLAARRRAQAQTDRSTDDVVTAEGEVDTTLYQAVLHAPGIVGVRGAGYSHDGMYSITRVTHKLSRGSYRQRFILARDGWGARFPTVRP